MKHTDPARMAAAERIGELGQLLAAGIQRLRARQGKAIPAAELVQDHLDVDAALEAPCAASMEATT